jgi:hypothetical protein
MDNNWASENLQVIRTLMERSSMYRRALAPVMTWAGVAGVISAVIGSNAHIDSAQHFAIYWVSVSFIVSVGAFLLIRRQALKDAEPFWSRPTRRVAQAALPGFFLGGVFSMLFILAAGETGTTQIAFPPIWMAFYGCALHAAGFFMPRGMRLLGWLFILAGSLLISVILSSNNKLSISPHTVMGISFGAIHLVYGIYLYWTENRKIAA